MVATIDIFKALSDEARLRILRAVFSVELSVAELVSVLGLPQSTVSRHLKPLREAELVTSRREGTSVYYRRGTALNEEDLADMLKARLKDVPGAEADEAAVRRALDARKKRSREFFDEVAGRYGTFTQPGGGWPALASALAAGFVDQDVADLGAGEGALTLLLARYARSVTAVDQSPQMLRLVEEQAVEAGVGSKVHAAEGDMEALPLKKESFDAAFLSQTLHHAARPARAVAEASRILRRGGRMIILDLVKHEQEWVREEWADQWLGFDEGELRTWMDDADVDVLHAERLEGSTPELAVQIVVGRKK